MAADKHFRIYFRTNSLLSSQQWALFIHRQGGTDAKLSRTKCQAFQLANRINHENTGRLFRNRILAIPRLIFGFTATYSRGLIAELA